MTGMDCTAPRRSAGRSCVFALCWLLAFPALAWSQAAGGGGTITGQVLERDAGRPVPLAMLDIPGTALAAQGDTAGRFRITNVPPGAYVVRARRLGFQPARSDTVRVAAGAIADVRLLMAAAVTQLEATRVTGAASRGSEAGLLEMQRTAATVIDGVSAEAIARTAGSNAADAITRVTGISVVDRKFTVVRGLPERYNNTLLNSVELPSPEPLRKVVPLDIFPASLLESIVASKTATPDKPGDFAGGSVEIRTKDFPERRVAQISVSQDGNTQSTFRQLPFMSRRGVGWLGFSGADRRAPGRPAPGTQDTETLERFAESLRNIWTPAPQLVPPGLGLNLSLGNRVRRVGYTLSLAYGTRVEYQPARLYRFTSDTSGSDVRGFVARESQTVVDWGGTGNVSVMVGAGSRLGWKNLYTRNAEESVAVQNGFETYRGPERLLGYQVRFVERELVQSQLFGDHVLAFLRNMRVEWKVTAARATRGEPDNRSATYTEDLETGLYALQANRQSFLWFRFLEDRVGSGNLDVTTPLPFFGGRELHVKAGGLWRAKERRFDADVFVYRPSDAPPSGTGFYTLPPEQAFSPEHVGTFGADVAVTRLDALGLPYRSRDDLGAAYGMMDVALLPWLRVVGGARLEHWRLDVRPASGVAAMDSATLRRERDLLASANITVALGSRMNLRLAASQTLARPDPRELTNDYYSPVTGECGNQGSADLRHTRIRNADVRWEWFPGMDQVLAISGFYKEFDAPVVEIVSLPQSSTCIAFYRNALSARSTGGEFEVRHALDFLPGIPAGLAGSVNVTVTDAEALLEPPGAGFDPIPTPLMGQSPWLANAGLSYASRGERLMLSVAANAFADRIVRYGATSINAGDGSADAQVFQIPHVLERGRVSVDARLQVRPGSRLTWTLAGRNLGNATQRFYQGTGANRIETGYARPGISLKLGVGAEF